MPLLREFFFYHIGQNVTTGYIIVGILSGPGGLGLIDAHLAEYLSELGVVLLLFSIGLEFSWKRFAQFGLISLIDGFLQVSLTLLLIIIGGTYFGLSFPAALVCGGAVALSSTQWLSEP